MCYERDTVLRRKQIFLLDFLILYKTRELLSFERNLFLFTIHNRSESARAYEEHCEREKSSRVNVVSQEHFL